MAYPENNIRFKHYGKGVEKLVKEAVEMEEGEEKEALIEAIGNLMKRHYLTWSRNSVDDKQIWLDLKKISRGKIEVSEDKELIATKEITTRSPQTLTNKKSNKKRHKRKPYKKKKY